MTSVRKRPRWCVRIRDDRRGVAIIEFAYSLPVFLALMLGGVELTSYVTTKMRISQIALHIADNASRIGSGTLLSSKTINETQINDLFTGAGLQAGTLQLYPRGRVILSSLEPMATPNTNSRYKIAWQRCQGSRPNGSSYGVTGATNLTGIGPAGRRVKTPEDSATMFVEVHYRYTPLIASSYVPSIDINEIASMTVRDRRDRTAIYNPDNATISNC